ncbi:hypothetical protein D3C84_557960 [compost metagenome]
MLPHALGLDFIVVAHLLCSGAPVMEHLAGILGRQATTSERKTDLVPCGMVAVGADCEQCRPDAFGVNIPDNYAQAAHCGIIELRSIDDMQIAWHGS